MAGAAILIVTAGTFTFTTVRRARAAVVGEKSDLSAARAQHAATQPKFKRLEAAVAKHRQDLDLLESRLLSEGQIGLFLEAVGALIDDQGVALRDLSPQQPLQQGQYLRRPIRLSCDGTVPDIHRFLYLLETMPRVLRIDHVKITASSDIERCQLDLQASLFERPRS